MVDHIVLTAPSQGISDVYALQLRVHLRSCADYRGATIHAIGDPFGCRVGSGGGIMNAVHYLVSLFGREDVLQRSVSVIVHSGGDSQRSPMHSVCGKAWASLKSAGHEATHPIIRLLEEVSSICRKLPRGSILVGCSDVILNLPAASLLSLESAQSIMRNGVSIIAVPAPMTTAKNHGVLVVQSDQFVGDSAVIRAKDYLQKPTVETMMSAGADMVLDGVQCALIDTGPAHVFCAVVGVVRLSFIYCVS